MCCMDLISLELEKTRYDAAVLLNVLREETRRKSTVQQLTIGE